MYGYTSAVNNVHKGIASITKTLKQVGISCFLYKVDVIVATRNELTELEIWLYLLFKRLKG